VVVHNVQHDPQAQRVEALGVSVQAGPLTAEEKGRHDERCTTTVQ